MVVHNETSTGATSRIGEIRKAMNRARHPALLIVDAISSLGSIDFRHDEWEVDVTVTGSQKGLDAAAGPRVQRDFRRRRWRRSKTSKMPRSYWDWEEMLKANESGFFPYTPATNLLYALHEALLMIEEEGLQNIFARHERYGDATRAAVRAWGLDILCEEPLRTLQRADRGDDAGRAQRRSPSRDHSREVRHVARHRPRAGGRQGVPHRPPRRVQRSHAGRHAERRRDGPGLAGVPFKKGGVQAALASLASSVGEPVTK